VHLRSAGRFGASTRGQSDTSEVLQGNSRRRQEPQIRIRSQKYMNPSTLDGFFFVQSVTVCVIGQGILVHRPDINLVEDRKSGLNHSCDAYDSHHA
jgi:hypothetical protein